MDHTKPKAQDQSAQEKPDSSAANNTHHPDAEARRQMFLNLEKQPFVPVDPRRSCSVSR